MKKLPKMEQIEFAFEDEGVGPDNNFIWWKLMKEKMARFIMLVFNILKE